MPCQGVAPGASFEPDMSKTSTSRRPRLLLVEDDTAVRRALQLLLTGRGFEVRAYGSGLALLADPERLAADALVADYRMPDLDGLMILRRLRDEGWNGRALLITAFHSGPLIDEALKIGFSRVVEKPLVDIAFADAVERLVAAP